MVDLTQKQGEAVRAILHWYKNEPRKQEFYLAGFAGVGKSTIAEYAIAELRAHAGVQKVVTAAYTGKAASVLQRKGIPSAQTIHSLLYLPVTDSDGNLTFVKRLETDGDFADLIVLDECSMIGKEIADDVRALGKKILILGDPGQLPPISGQGEFTNRQPDAFLTEIHRQAAESPIIELATMVREGKQLPLRYDRGSVKVAPLTFDSREAMFDPATQTLCGTHATRWNYTQEIRKRMGIKDSRPQPGERIICCMTNYKYGFFNGYMGVINGLRIENREKVHPDGKVEAIPDWYMDVKLDDQKKGYNSVLTDPCHFQNHFNNGKVDRLAENKASYGRYSEFDWGHVITTHKAQGSGWPNVTVIDDSDVFRENKNKWLYTAITRAETTLTVLLRRYR